jgi:hypothetical protein
MRMYQRSDQAMLKMFNHLFDSLFERIFLPILKLLIDEIQEVNCLLVNICIKFKLIHSLNYLVWLYSLKIVICSVQVNI